MLLLTSTSDKLQVVTDASADIEVHASWMDLASGVVTPGRTNTASITTATTTDIVGSPGASTYRNVKHLNLRNNHASTACNVTVEHTDGTTVETLMKVALLAGETLALDDRGTWVHFDTNGGNYPAVLPAASQAEQEAGTSLVKTVTPGTQHYHPSAAKFWCKCLVNGTTAVSYNVSSLTDGGAGRMTVNIGTNFSSADYVYSVSIENLDASIDAAIDGQIPMLGLAGQAAGTLALINKNETGTAAADPTRWSVIGFGDQ